MYLESGKQGQHYAIEKKSNFVMKIVSTFFTFQKL